MLLGLEKRLESVDKLLRYQSDSSIFHTIAGLRPEAHVQGRQVVLDSDTLQQYPALLLCQETVSVRLGCFLRAHRAVTQQGLPPRRSVFVLVLPIVQIVHTLI